MVVFSAVIVFNMFKRYLGISKTSFRARMLSRTKKKREENFSGQIEIEDTSGDGFVHHVIQEWPSF